MPSPAELLRCYVDDHDEGAFAALVRQNLDLVYAAALRRAGGRAHLAEEIAQKVFGDLARKAAVLVRHPALVGWLHQSTRYAAIDIIRSEHRRQKLAQSLSSMPDVDAQSEPAVDWERLRPVIDEAMDQLTDRDREIVLLRFFKGLRFAELATRLMLPESTTRFRAERALDKLRLHFDRRGVTSTSAALGVVLGQQTLAAVPAGLATSISATAQATAHTVTPVLVTTILMSKLTTSTAVAVLAAGLTALVWNRLSSAPGAIELADLRAEHSRLVATTAPDASAETLAAAADEFDRHAAELARVVHERFTRARGTRHPSASGGHTAAGGVDEVVTSSGHRNRGLTTPSTLN